ncbi:general stress protein [Arthrobacter sp. RCC_34]|uniref:general stress protein n=1 Tax=Arthrobacter sp. RCC_34 TaxID=3239230 RepID=UPI00352487AC
MSNLFGAPRIPEELRSVPQGVTVGSYNSYLDAQKAVDYLADQQFPVQYVSIVGNDLKLVERVTGRLSYPRVAMSGLLSGVWFGLFIGLLLSLFSPGGAFSVVTSVLMGAAFFALFGIVSYAMQRGKRDFTSTSQVLASSYDVIVAPEVAGEASRLLLQLPMRGNDGGARQHSQQQGPQGGQHPGYGQGHGQPQAPQEPQRPEGWGNPYGQRSEDAVQQAQTPEQQAPSTVSSDYRDLPDGRPQYGVRLNQTPPAAPAAPAQEPQQAEPQSAEQQHAEQQIDAGQQHDAAPQAEPHGEHSQQQEGQHDEPQQDQHGEPHPKDPRGE